MENGESITELKILPEFKFFCECLIITKIYLYRRIPTVICCLYKAALNHCRCLFSRYRTIDVSGDISAESIMEKYQTTK